MRLTAKGKTQDPKPAASDQRHASKADTWDGKRPPMSGAFIAEFVNQKTPIAQEYQQIIRTKSFLFYFRDLDASYLS